MHSISMVILPIWWFKKGSCLLLAKVVVNCLEYYKPAKEQCQKVNWPAWHDDNHIDWAVKFKLILSMLGKIFSKQFFLKIGFDISCKLPPEETVCMKCQINVKKIALGNKEHVTD